MSRAGLEPGRDQSNEEPGLLVTRAVSRSGESHGENQGWWSPEARSWEMLHDCGTWETLSSLEKLEEAGSPMGGSGGLSRRRSRGSGVGASGPEKTIWSLFGFRFQTCSGLPQSLRDHSLVSPFYLKDLQFRAGKHLVYWSITWSRSCSPLWAQDQTESPESYKGGRGWALPQQESPWWVLNYTRSHSSIPSPLPEK